MLEPKYDEDTINLGYLKKVISDTEEEIDDTYKNVSRHYASRPQPPYYKGDTWIDRDIVYTCINTRTIGIYQDSDWVTESGAKTEAERKNKTYLTQPSNYNPGDMWILQSDEDHRAGKKGEILISTAGRREYDADDWINMLGYGTIKSINEVAGNLNNAINRIGDVEEAIEDGIIITFYQDNEPEGKHIGDLWYVTGEVEGYTKGKIYRYDGANWIILDDPAIQKAFDEANEARIVADGKIQSFYSEEEPTQDMGVGDLWIDLKNNNQLYRYNGTNWVAVYDTRINELVTTVETVTERVTTIETDLGEIDLKVKETTTSITTIEGNVSSLEGNVNAIQGNVSTIQGNIGDIQNNIINLQFQIDGSIQFWNGSEIPTLNNYPANEWTTEEAKNNHRADIYTVIEDVDGELKQGKSYRFDKVGDTWQWIELTDNELSAVQALAQSKAKVFVTTPKVPYSIGDLWINGGKLYRCKTSKDSNGSYSSTDWEIAVNYTDDTVAELAKTLANNAQNTADSAVNGVNNITNTQGQAEGKNIHIEDSAEEPFVEVELHGESIQEGIPTSDNKVEIENLEGRNKLNINGNLEQITGVHTTVSNNQIHIPNSEGNSHSALFDYIEVEPNKDINISFDLVQGTARMGLRLYDKDKNIINSSSVSLPNFTYNIYYQGYYYTGNNISTTIPENVKYIRYLTIALNGTKENIYENLQIEKGNKRTPYAPYNSLEFKVEGKNLCNGVSEGYWLATTANKAGKTDADCGLAILVGGGKYTVSTNITQTRYRIACANELPTSTSVNTYNGVYADNTNRTITIDTTGYKYLIVNATDLNSIQIKKGETATEYEPYKSQAETFPLGEGEKLYQGSFLNDNGKNHTRGQYVFTGTEGWSLRSSNSNGTYTYMLSNFVNYKQVENVNALCSHFKYGGTVREGDATKTKDIGCWLYWQVGHNDKVIYINSTIASLTEFKTWLATEYANGTPVVLEFDLADPETVPYTEEQQTAWNKIKALMTYKNITNITSDAYAKVTYMRDNGLDVYETKQNAQKRYTETSEKLTEQKMTVDGVITQVSETNRRLTNDYLTAEQVNAELDTTKDDIEILKQNQVTMEQTSKNLKIAIDTINNEGVTKVKTSMGYTFDDEGMKTDKEGEPTGTIINEAAVQVIDKTGASRQNLLYAGYVKEGNTDYPAYIGQAIVASANMIVRNYLVVPNSRFEEYTNPVLGGKGTGVFEV